MSNPSTEIKVQKISLADQLETVFAIRRTVFVEEQQVDEREEYDEFENSSVHFLAFHINQPVGTARWRRTTNGIKLERFAVLKEYRSSGVGSALLKAVLDDLPDDNSPVYLHAQLTAIGLYKKFGFLEQGDIFTEANIQHYKMMKS